MIASTAASATSPPPAGQAAPADSAAPPRARWSLIVALCSMWCGLNLTECVSNQVLPLTIRHFTANADVIGYILAINPMFGFIANPLVGVISDRVWTPVGRRAFFLVTGAPIVAVCLLYVPGARILWHLVTLVVVYQFFQDVLWGSDHPLIADLVPPEQRTLITGLMMASSQVLAFAFNRYGLGVWLDAYGEEMLYRVAALGQVGLVAFAALFLHERRTTPGRRPALTVKRYIADFLGHRILRRFALLGFTQFAFQNMVQGFVVLFAVETMRLKPAAFGPALGWLPIVSGILAIPYGIAAERFISKRTALAAGYATAVAGCVLGCFARTASDLTLVVVLFSFCIVGGQVAQKSFFTEFIPRDIIGQVCGAYNICLAVGRTAALAAGGLLIHRLGNDYWWIWPIAAVLGIVSILVVLRIPDPRFESRRSGNPSASQP